MNKIRKIKSFNFPDLMLMIEKTNNMTIEKRDAIIKRTCELEKNSEKIQIMDQLVEKISNRSHFINKVANSLRITNDLHEIGIIFVYLYRFIDHIEPNTIDNLLSKVDSDLTDNYMETVIINSADCYNLIEFSIKCEKYLNSSNLHLITQKLYNESVYLKDFYGFSPISLESMNIYRYASSLESLSSDDVSILIRKMIDLDDTEYIYYFRRDVSNISNEDKKLLEQKILESENLKYICLLAVYINKSLIKEIYGSKAKLYAHIVAYDLFDDFEEEEIVKKLFYKPTKFIDDDEIFDNISKYNAVHNKVKAYKNENKKSKKDNK